MIFRGFPSDRTVLYVVGKKNMADRPSVLFASTCDITPDEVIRLLFKDSEPSEIVAISDSIDARTYHIDNKYYKTSINLCALKRKVLSDEKFASTVQGTVIYFDSSNKDCLRDVESWLTFLIEYQLDIKILLCKNCLEETNDGCEKKTVQEWCISKGFELVELDPVLDEEDEDDDFPETTGINRIIQALNAHVWPNLVLKNSNNPTDCRGNGIDAELSSLANQLHLEESLEELLENDDDFSQLFSQLPELKARVSALQGEDRMTAAVQIVEAFWKAMSGNGDNEDILDL